MRWGGAADVRSTSSAAPRALESLRPRHPHMSACSRNRTESQTIIGSSHTPSSATVLENVRYRVVACKPSRRSLQARSRSPAGLRRRSRRAAAGRRPRRCSPTHGGQRRGEVAPRARRPPQAAASSASVTSSRVRPELGRHHRARREQPLAGGERPLAQGGDDLAPAEQAGHRDVRAEQRLATTNGRAAAPVRAASLRLPPRGRAPPPRRRAAPAAALVRGRPRARRLRPAARRRCRRRSRTARGRRRRAAGRPSRR